MVCSLYIDHLFLYNILYVFQIPFHTLLPMNSTFGNGKGVKEKLNFLFNEEHIEEKAVNAGF